MLTLIRVSELSNLAIPLSRFIVLYCGTFLLSKVHVHHVLWPVLKNKLCYCYVLLYQTEILGVVLL